MKKRGFDRLRGMVVAGAMGIAGFAGGVTARAAATSTGLTLTRGNVVWSDIANNTNFPSSSTVTTTNGDVYSLIIVTSTTVTTTSAGGTTIITVTTSSGPSAFGIRDATLSNSTTTFTDAFDNALLLAVDGNLFINPTGMVDLTGDTVTSQIVTNIVAGIDAQISYYFMPTRPVVRALFSLTNTTGSPITIDPVILSDFGSDSDTRVSATSSGDRTIDNADLWYITDEGHDENDPRIMTSRYGTGAPVVPTNALTPSDSSPMIAVSGLRYHTIVPANETVRIIVFMELSDPDDAKIPDAVSATQDYKTLNTLKAAGLLTGLDDIKLNEIINYAPLENNKASLAPIYYLLLD